MSQNSGSGPQAFWDALSGDLKLTHIIALATGVAVIVIGLFYLKDITGVVSSTTSSGDLANMTIAFIGGTTAILVVGIGANAALGGSYLNAAASLTGVTVTSGPTAPVAPATQTAQGLITGQTISQLQQSIDTLTVAVQALQKPATPTPPATT